ncbi:hypothetical protein RJ639_040278 [Escallonia herrerae]|uniref:DUF7794 domain-containing protein n=1 Tax=Escallonia herrerae TaxID=1293975 RepID=A0AA89BCM5_9ASTE|nr:hypothetical protein RJ639_040278 [Escallonia herrerae]
MDSVTTYRLTFTLFITLSLLCPQFKADGTGSVFFLDSQSHQYFRPRSSDSTSEADFVSLTEVGAAVSVLLGFPPPSTLSAASSHKLNEVLMPNPFDRPRTVFMLEVRGAEILADSHSAEDSDDSFITRVFGGRRVVFGQNGAAIELPEEDDLSVISLNDSDDCTDNEINDFASWLGGSYVTTSLEPLNGELTIPLASGGHLKLYMSKKADRAYVTSLVSLILNIRRAAELHDVLSGRMQNPAELLAGTFDGIKALQEEYKTEGFAQHALQLFATSVSKIFDSLQTAYKGRIVGVIVFNAAPAPSSGKVLNVITTSRPVARWLEETNSSSSSTAVKEVVLVRRTLAWITGIILLIATLLGVSCFLEQSPCTCSFPSFLLSK